MSLCRTLPSALMGGCAFGVTQWLLFRGGTGWFLDSGAAVSAVFLVMTVLAVAQSAWMGAQPIPQVIAALALTGGAAVALTITLVIMGPSALFPLVIAVGTIVIGVAVTLGTLLGVVFSLVHTRLSEQH